MELEYDLAISIEALYRPLNIFSYNRLDLFSTLNCLTVISLSNVLRICLHLNTEYKPGWNQESHVFHWESINRALRTRNAVISLVGYTKCRLINFIVGREDVSPCDNFVSFCASTVDKCSRSLENDQTIKYIVISSDQPMNHVMSF